MSMQKVIHQIQELAEGKTYAIVFNHRVTEKDLNQLKEVCQAGNLKVLILTDARVVPLDKVAAAIARADTVPLDMTEAANV